MRPLPIRPASAADSTPVALRGKASLRAVCATALAAAIGFAPAVMIASPAAASIEGFVFDDATIAGAEGSKLTFTVNREGGAVSLAATTLEWRIVAGTATADEDYTLDTGTLEFPGDTNPSEDQSMEIEVQGLSDTLDEDNETFTLEVWDPDAEEEEEPITATGTLTDDDAAPSYTLSVSEATVDETAIDEDTLNSVEITAELSTASGRDIEIPVSTIAGTAKAGQDYTALDADLVISIDEGETSGTLAETVQILDDELYEEALQDFTVKGGTSTNTTGSDSATVNIADDEEQSKLTIEGGDLEDEGDTEGFMVGLAPESERAVTVRWDTADGPGDDDEDSDEDAGVAKGGVDYTTAGATLTFTPGQSEKSISVKTLADTIDEVSPELFHVHLSSPTVAAIEKADDTAGITDEDDPPLVTLTPDEVTEGNAGSTKQTFTLKLSKASGRPVTVTYDVASGDGDNPATAGLDFTATDGEVVFAPGETTKTFGVNVVGDKTYELTETFSVTLGTDGTAALAEDLGIDELATEVSIEDDDTKPTFSVASVTMAEGDVGSVALFTVKLSNPTYEDVVFDVEEADGGTADEGGTTPGADDFDSANSPMTIPAGQVNGYVYFLVNGDEVYEQTETVKHTITLDPDTDSTDYATGTAKTATLTLTNDDAAPVLTVLPTSGAEGATVDVTAVVAGVAQADTQYSISYSGSSMNGSDAAELDDFTNPGTTQVTVDGGLASGSIVDLPSVKFTDDTVGEPSETVVVSGSSLTGSVTSTVITILDNDNYAPPVKPTLVVGKVRVGAGPMPITGKVAANASVDLWAAPVGGGALTKVATDTADAQGNYAFTYDFTDTGMRFATKASGLTSAESTVWMRHDPTLIASSTRAGTATLKVNGDPTLGGLNVILQQYIGNGQWKKAGVGTTGPSGLLIKTITRLKTGSTYTFRAYIVGDASVGLQGGYSGIRKATIK